MKDDLTSHFAEFLYDQGGKNVQNGVLYKMVNQ